MGELKVNYIKKANIRVAASCILTATIVSLTGCASKEQKQFVDDFNTTTSIEFNIPYINSSDILNGYDETYKTIMEEQLSSGILAEAVPKASDGNYLMTNTTLMGALCNTENNLGNFINPAVTSPSSTLTTQNVENINQAISSYINGVFIGKNLGEDIEAKQLSQKYIAANSIYNILPSRDINDNAINPNTTTLTRAQAMVALMNAFYGSGVIPEDYPDKVDTTKIDSAIKLAVENGLIAEDSAQYLFLTTHNKELSWMDQFSYLKISDNEMGANLLSKEITFGEFEYILSNLMIKEGLIEETSINRDTTSIEKKTSDGYTVKNVSEIVKKSTESTKMINSIIPENTLALLRSLYTYGANETVEAELYNVFKSMESIGMNKNNQKIYDTVTINEVYSEILSLAEYIRGNAIEWKDYKWVDPNPAPEPTPEPEHEYLDLDRAVASWLIGNGLVDVNKLKLTSEDDPTGEKITEELMLIYNGKNPINTITESTHKELSITGINLSNEQYENLFVYLESKGFTVDNIGDFCINPFGVSYKEWKAEKAKTEAVVATENKSNEASENDKNTETTKTKTHEKA